MASEPGMVAGRVVSDAFIPLVGASVVLTGAAGAAPSSQATDATGAFMFMDVVPGEYKVTISSPGRQTVTKAVNMTSGGDAELGDVMLDWIPSQAPYSSTQMHRGLLGCGAAVAPNPIPFNFPVCGLLSAQHEAGGPDLHTVDDFEQRFYFKDVPTAETAGIVFEMTWKPTQPTSKELGVEWHTPNCHTEGSGTSACTFGTKEGVNPLRLVVNGTKALGEFKKAPKEDFNATHMDFFSAVHPVGGATGHAYPVDAGVSLQQDFDQYVTVFFRAPPAPGFTALV